MSGRQVPGGSARDPGGSGTQTALPRVVGLTRSVEGLNGAKRRRICPLFPVSVLSWGISSHLLLPLGSGLRPRLPGPQSFRLRGNPSTSLPGLQREDSRSWDLSAPSHTRSFPQQRCACTRVPSPLPCRALAAATDGHVKGSTPTRITGRMRTTPERVYTPHLLALSAGGASGHQGPVWLRRDSPAAGTRPLERC